MIDGTAETMGVSLSPMYGKFYFFISKLKYLYHLHIVKKSSKGYINEDRSKVG